MKYQDDFVVDPQSELGGRSFYLGFLGLLSLIGLVGYVIFVKVRAGDSFSPELVSISMMAGISFIALALSLLGLAAGVKCILQRNYDRTLGVAGSVVSFGVLFAVGLLTWFFITEVL